MMADLLDEEDQNAFKHLKELNVEDSEDVKSGFKISFVRIHSAHASSSPSYLLLGVRQQPLLQEQGTHQNFPIQWWRWAYSYSIQDWVEGGYGM